ncbi:MAG TPA: GH116 family glycosyl-hydrolase [Candidatus Baltobacteraceae bacterium]|jgi:uncharacterized protein (DUF608 family)|nr:GH116 family glycosyl-hydrolase [Candidatus Baltobacteraceae bacterium]
MNNRSTKAHWDRREFLKISAATTLGLAFSRLPVMAGPFTRADFEHLVPADKKLRPEWVKSLFERGTPEILRGSDLKFIGMPVGGIGAGQLYLGGDGRLWHWDIFNQSIQTGSEHYARPLTPASPLQQQFTLTIGPDTRTLDGAGFSEVAFRGEYPIGTVEYADAGVPVAVKLEAFSPFIPLNTDDSSLPATILQFTLRNTSALPVEATLSGQLENGVCLNNRSEDGLLRNRVVREVGLTTLLCSAEKAASRPTAPLEELPDFGTMALALLGEPAERASADQAGADETAPFTGKLSGALGRKLTLAPGQPVLVTFVLAWYFPNLSLGGPLKKAGRYYATRFSSAHGVAQYVAEQFDRLAGGTRLWRDTWYDSTLPFWFLDRSFLNASILATSTCFRFANERFYGWEGVGCCEGTCGHVYQYAHATARLFPDLERTTREKIDFGIALQPDGAIHFRGEFNNIPAVDAQSGTILRALREHQMAPDAGFLERTWPGIKRATQWLIAKDGDGDGLIKGNQHNTLDTDWFGAVAWLSGLYLAALAAAAEMADEAGDAEFALQCRGILETGRKNLVGQLFDGEYFIDKVDPKHLDAINSGTGCEIDQVFGQSWAFQVGLPRILPRKETVSALQSLWRYNFSPDVGPYRENYKPGRWYALAGEAGLLMCTFPRRDWDYAQARGKGPEWAAGYFNECMNGFEYQAAGHMIWEGLTMEGLAVARAVHDRYHASRRNPWNEVECGDHYARSMASYGVFIAACGFEYHGPKGYLAFDPRVNPHDFRAAFTSAEGWGTFTQKITGRNKTATVEIKWGTLRLKTLALSATAAPTSVHAQLDGKKLRVRKRIEDGRVLITFVSDLHLAKGQQLRVTLA